jgi:glycosyltransferase involved in cell wall biosynthesis
VVYVGRLSYEKDVATLLRAAAIAVSQRPSFRLQIAGTGSCEPELVGLSVSLGLKGCVEFLGEVRDVPGLLSGASLFVLPSLTEGMPLTVLEAMACGLPVVATRVGGTPEAVTDSVCGLLVDPADPAQLARAMLEIHENPEKGAKMGACGRRRIEEHFDIRVMVSRYESLYEEVLRGATALAA